MIATASRLPDRDPVLAVRGLCIDFAVDGVWVSAVNDLDYTIAQGEILALVGESGSGKSASSLAIMDLLPKNARVRGSICLRGQELLGIAPRSMRQIRGAQAAAIFQEPMTALNPVHTIGAQIVEQLRIHTDAGPQRAVKRAVELLGLVEIADPEQAFVSYPHQLSGGQRQRAMIAQALALDPGLLIADEPTTALDVTVQAEILDLLRSLRDRVGSAVLLITHNMGVVADLADTMLVMREGVIVERGDVGAVFAAPQHPYTQQLLAAVPYLGRDSGVEWLGEQTLALGADHTESSETAESAENAETAENVETAENAENVETAENAETAETAENTWNTENRESTENGPAHEQRSSPEQPDKQPPALNFDRVSVVYGKAGKLGAFPAVREVSFRLAAGEIVGMVGESGSGKSTIGRAAIGLQPIASGALHVCGVDISRWHAHTPRLLRGRVGVVFQDPASSLNPRLPIGESIGEPLLLGGVARGGALDNRVGELLDSVHLPGSYRNRFPHELSGGEKQRVGIARALSLGPELLIADEPTSALDVSVQAKVLELLRDLQRELGFACLFISHDLAVVESLADRIVVLRGGAVEEIGETQHILRAPGTEYTRRLIAAVPVPDPAAQRARRMSRSEGAGQRGLRDT